MLVMCIESTPSSYPNSGLKGNYYYIDRNSIFLNHSGEAYGALYDLEDKLLASQVCLNRFRTVTMKKGGD